MEILIHQLCWGEQSKWKRKGYHKKASYDKMRMVSQANLKEQEAVQMDNKSLAHTRWKCQYHIVFIPKYRKKVLYGRLRNDVREIISTLCKYQNVEIVAGAVCVDHVHISVAIPPFWASSNIALMRANTNHHLKWWL